MSNHLPWDVIPLSIYGTITTAIGTGFLWSWRRATNRATLMHEMPTTPLNELHPMLTTARTKKQQQQKTSDDSKSNTDALPPPYVEIKGKIGCSYPVHSNAAPGTHAAVTRSKLTIDYPTKDADTGIESRVRQTVTTDQKISDFTIVPAVAGRDVPVTSVVHVDRTSVEAASPLNAPNHLNLKRVAARVANEIGSAAAGGSGGERIHGLSLAPVSGSERKLSLADGVMFISHTRSLSDALPAGYRSIAATFKTREEILPVGAAVYALGHVRLDPVSNRVVFYNARVTDQPFVISVKSEEDMTKAYTGTANRALVLGSVLSLLGVSLIAADVYRYYYKSSSSSAMK